MLSGFVAGMAGLCGLGVLQSRVIIEEQLRYYALFTARKKCNRTLLCGVPTVG